MGSHAMKFRGSPFNCGITNDVGMWGIILCDHNQTKIEEMIAKNYLYDRNETKIEKIVAKNYLYDCNETKKEKMVA